jgi:hypothetical protein
MKDKRGLHRDSGKTVPRIAAEFALLPMGRANSMLPAAFPQSIMESAVGEHRASYGDAGYWIAERLRVQVAFKSVKSV